MTEDQEKEKVIAVLEREIQWQWRWEKLNRFYHHTTIWLQWVCTLAVVVLSIYQVQLSNQLEKWVIFTIAALSTLGSTIPGLSAQFKFQQRQQVYDEMARAYELIKIKIEIDAISAKQALKLFSEIHEKPTERVIRETA
ncbi:hypothetical protein [Uliginosibacterium sediminicola]|uniref:SMODS and SLOG-associating 2TM effector domain-containing protein n=1 Tax=Uliginosibacterium sediminicola TaxID=2024550 RepID=A0ABU9Z1Z1_9RHOO